MRPQDFADRSPGELVEISGGIAFVPNLLPPQLASSWELHEANADARGALGEFMGRARVVQNPALIIGPLLVREAVESVQIEGTHTHVQGVLLEQAGARLATAEERLDHLEAVRYLDAVHLGADTLADGRPLTLHLIRSLHAELLRETRGADRNPGAFRRGLVLIGNQHDTPATARFVPPPPEQLEYLLRDLAGFLDGPPAYSALISAAIAHYQFETIHPFEDGNGRLGRLLVTLYLMSKEVISQPLLYLSEFFNENRERYMELLRLVSTEGQWNEWILFFLEAVKVQSIRASARVNRVMDLSDDYHQRVRSLGARSGGPAAALDLVLDKVVVSAPQVQAFAGCDYATAKRALEVLSTLGVVTQVPNTYPQRWVAQELLEKVYEV